MVATIEPLSCDIQDAPEVTKAPSSNDVDPTLTPSAPPATLAAPVEDALKPAETNPSFAVAAMTTLGGASAAVEPYPEV